MRPRDMAISWASNLLYNLSQRAPGSPLSERDLKSIKEASNALDQHCKPEFGNPVTFAAASSEIGKQQAGSTAAEDGRS